MSNLTSQADPPTFKSLSFIKAGAPFSKNQGLGFKDVLDGVLEFSWVHFGCSWGFLGGSFVVFAGFRWHLEFSKFLIGFPSGLNCFFFASSFAPVFEVFVFLIFEPLGVDLVLPSWPSDFQKPWFYEGGSSIFEKTRFGI